MPHQIGTGTVNLSVNMPVGERSEIGRLAFRMGFKSVGHFTRHMMLKGLEQQDPAAAQRVRDVRRAYYGATLLGVFVVAIVCGHDELRRPTRRLRSVEEAREACEV